MSNDQFGCHVDLGPGENPDGCVFDYANPDDCIHAAKLHSQGKGRSGCSYWKPIASPVSKVARLEAINASLIASLREIAAIHRGIEMSDSDADKADYWGGLALRYRDIARAAIASAEQQSPSPSTAGD